MKKARIIISLVLAIKNYFKRKKMAKKTSKETTEEQIVEAPVVKADEKKKENQETAAPVTGFQGASSRDFHSIKK